MTVVDLDLGGAVRMEVPVPGRSFQAGLSERHGAVVSLEELVVHDRQGRPLWRHERTSPTATTSWPTTPPPVPKSTGRRVGLHVAMGQDTPLSHLACLDNGRITGCDLPGGHLNGYDRAGERYLSLPHTDEVISIRDLETGEAVVTRRYEPDTSPLMEAAALVSDDHVLLSTRTLRPQTTFHYGRPMTHNSIAATDGRGRWVTRGRGEDTLRWWRLPDPVDAMPGQRRLW